MIDRSNRDIALQMIEKISAGIIDETLVTEDVCWWIPGRGTTTKADFIEIIAAFQALLDGEVTMTVGGITAEGDRVAVEAETYAKLKNGRIYNNTYHFLFLFRNGKIYLAKEYNNSLHAAEVFGGTL